MTNLIVPEVPGLRKLLAVGAMGPLMSNPVTAPLGYLLSGAFDLFGGDKPPQPSASPAGGGDPAGAGGAYSGSSAEAEAAAAEQLKKQTDALTGIDKQIDDLANQITGQNDASKQKLLDLKSDIDHELSYIDQSSDTNVVKSAAVSKFLQDKAADIGKVITDAAESAAKNKGELEQIAGQYSGQGGGDLQELTDPSANPSQTTTPADPAAPQPAVDPSVGGYEVSPYGGGGAGDYGDDSDPMEDLGGMLPQMASALPGAMSGLNPLGGLGSPFGDLGGLLGDAARGGGSDDRREDLRDGDNSDKKHDSSQAQEKHDQTGQSGGQNQGGSAQGQPQSPPAGGPTPAAAPPPGPPAPTMVTRPDGTNGTASSPAAAAAARAHLGGASLEDAYKAAGITLPGPGTPLKDTLSSLSSAQVGDLAVFKDKYVMLLGDNEVYLDGQEQPAAALAKLTGFVAFIHPPASSMPDTTTVAAPATAAPGAAAPPIGA